MTVQKVPMFHQYVDHCRSHQGCAEIVCRSAQDEEVWSSHLAEAIHVSHRINPQVPATDLRERRGEVHFAPVCPECSTHPAWPAE